MNPRANANYHNPNAPRLQHRAVIAADGTVALIADNSGIQLDVIPGGDDRTTTTVELSPTQFAQLLEESGVPDKGVVYDHIKRKFKIETLS